jgi:hypothetical protein
MPYLRTGGIIPVGMLGIAVNDQSGLKVMIKVLHLRSLEIIE